jgi:drug/metabolite transporter (DMT)-like permease
MPRLPTKCDWMTLLALTLFWGTAFLFNELALRSFPPVVVVALRTGIALCLLLVVLRISGSGLPSMGRGWAPIGAVALLGTIVPFNLVAWAQQHIDSSLTAVLMAVMPLFVLTLAHYFVPGQRLSVLKLGGFGVGFGGVFLVIGPDLGNLGTSNMQVWAMLATLAAAFSYAAGSIYARRIGEQDPISLASGTMLISAVCSSAIAAPQIATIQWPAAVESMAAIAVLGLIATGLSTILFFRLVQGPGPTFLSIVNYLVPAWAVLLGAVILSETLSSSTLVGLALILTGIAISEAGPRLVELVGLRRAPGELTGTLATSEKS